MLTECEFDTSRPKLDFSRSRLMSILVHASGSSYLAHPVLCAHKSLKIIRNARGLKNQSELIMSYYNSMSG